MIIEIGHFSLFLAFSIGVSSIILGVVLLYGKSNSLSENSYISSLFVESNIGLVRRLIWVVFFLVSLSLLTLIYSFLTNDFSVKYVYENSSTLLPDIFLISATWGAHEGSFLLWTWLLNICIFICSCRKSNRDINNQFLHLRMWIILIIINIGFKKFILV